MAGWCSVDTNCPPQKGRKQALKILCIRGVDARESPWSRPKIKLREPATTGPASTRREGWRMGGQGQGPASREHRASFGGVAYPFWLPTAARRDFFRAAALILWAARLYHELLCGVLFSLYFLFIVHCCFVAARLSSGFTVWQLERDHRRYALSCASLEKTVVTHTTLICGRPSPSRRRCRTHTRYRLGT